MARDERPLDELDDVSRAVALDDEVAVARRDDGAALGQDVTVLGLAHLHRTDAREALREGTREVIRHMLDDDHRRRITRAFSRWHVRDSQTGSTLG